MAQEREAWLRKEAKLKTEAESLAEMLSKVTLTSSQRAGEEGHLFGSVTSKDVADRSKSRVITSIAARFKWTRTFARPANIKCRSACIAMLQRK